MGGCVAIHSSYEFVSGGGWSLTLLQDVVSPDVSRLTMSFLDNMQLSCVRHVVRFDSSTILPYKKCWCGRRVWRFNPLGGVCLLMANPWIDREILVFQIFLCMSCLRSNDPEAYLVGKVYYSGWKVRCFKSMYGTRGVRQTPDGSMAPIVVLPIFFVPLDGSAEDSIVIIECGRTTIHLPVSAIGYELSQRIIKQIHDHVCWLRRSGQWPGEN